MCRKRFKNNTQHHFNEIAEDEVNEENDESSETEVTFAVRSQVKAISKRKLPKVCAKINNVQARVIVDTGSTMNTIDQSEIIK